MNEKELEYEILNLKSDTYRINHEQEVLKIRLENNELKSNINSNAVFTMKPYFDNSNFKINSKKVIMDCDLEILEFFLFNKNYTSFINDYNEYKKFKIYFNEQIQEMIKEHGGFESFLKNSKSPIILEKIKRDFIKLNGG